MKSAVTAALATSIALCACSTHQANVDYSEFKSMPIKAGPIAGATALGPIAGEHGGAIWNECTEKAKGSVEELIMRAQALGANAIGDVIWTASNSSTPTCKKEWGYFAIWPFVLTPLFMSTKVTGVAYKVQGGAKSKHALMMLPTTPEEKAAFVNRVVSGN